MTPAEAVATLRAQPALADLIRDSYLDPESSDYWDRFYRSAEFAAVLALIGRPLAGLRILDLGAGAGLAAHAFARSGAAFVCALEPDPSDVVGYGTLLNRPPDSVDVSAVAGLGEGVPFGDESFDVVYCRQVLHHARDLPSMLREIARVVRRGGQVVATREHVVRSDRDLERFLRSHPVHGLTGGEHAFRRQEYAHAFTQAGLVLRTVLRPLESIVNAYPRARSESDLAGLPAKWLAKLGPVGRTAARLPYADRLVRDVAVRMTPGSMYTFVATRP